MTFPFLNCCILQCFETIASLERNLSMKPQQLEKCATNPLPFFSHINYDLAFLPMFAKQFSNVITISSLSLYTEERSSDCLVYLSFEKLKISGFGELFKNILSKYSHVLSPF